MAQGLPAEYRRRRRRHRSWIRGCGFRDGGFRLSGCTTRHAPHTLLNNYLIQDIQVEPQLSFFSRCESMQWDHSHPTATKLLNASG